MSKYIYATVYEQFTGLKPPEPKAHTQRRRRGYGHPYRMRLNAQDSEHLEMPGNESSDDQHTPQPRNNASPTPQHRGQNEGSRQARYGKREMKPLLAEGDYKKSPKVTYRKRRQYHFSANHSTTDSHNY